MAEEVKEEKKQEGGGSSPVIKTAVIIGGVVLVPAITALLIAKFLILPMVATPEEETPKERVEQIPADAVTIEFEEAQATVLTDDPNAAAPLLLYQIAMVCNNAETMALVEAKKTWFTALLGQLHRNRTRSELNDPYMQETILKQGETGGQQPPQALLP